jgi:hypothetical protein
MRGSGLGGGVVEIIAGLTVLSRWTKLGSYIVMLWLLGIAVNLPECSMTFAMRDVEIAIGAFALLQLTAVREQQATTNLFERGGGTDAVHMDSNAGLLSSSSIRLQSEQAWNGRE